MKRELERVEVPDAEAARERARDVVLAAHAEREVVPVRRPPVRLVAVGAVLAAAAVVGAALSPPGEAVVDRLREVIGVERAQPALFRLPTSGRLLVASDAGVWVVERDGKRRLLPGYREASWSPFGRFVVATKANELAAFEPEGDVRWTLARRGVRFPRWTGTETDTRIAYAAESGIRVVAGDGEGDRLLAPTEKGPLAWRPGTRRELAYVSTREVRVEDTTTGRVLWRANRPFNEPVLRLEWSPDGRRLLVLSAHALRIFDLRGRVVAQDDPSDATRDADAAFRPGSRTAFVIRRAGDGSSVFRLDTGRSIFDGVGAFTELAWSPDGRWLLVGWRSADQWVFVRADGGSIRAVANVSQQFRSRTFPRVQGWCCTREPRK